MTTRTFEFPPETMKKFRKAQRLEIWTVAYLISTTVLTAITMGNSQTMKTAWFEDILSLVPPVAFLIAGKIFLRRPTSRFPYGFHRVISIAYLFGALSLFAVGVFLSYDSIMTLVHSEHPTIGLVSIFGFRVWLGYAMILVLLWGTIPSYFLGKMKIPLAEELHDKNLFTDAKMNKANWMTALAAIAGIVGIGFGLWWTDAAAAIIISLDIIYDGFNNLKRAIYDLIDERPGKVEKETSDPIIKKVRTILDGTAWVSAYHLRLREEGHIYFGEAFVVPEKGDFTVDELEKLASKILQINWRLHDITIMPVNELKNE